MECRLLVGSGLGDGQAQRVFEFQLQQEQSQASLLHVDGEGGASRAGTVG